MKYMWGREKQGFLLFGKSSRKQFKTEERRKMLSEW